MKSITLKVVYFFLIELALIANVYLPEYSQGEQIQSSYAYQEALFAQAETDDQSLNPSSEVGINLTLSPTFVTLVAEPSKPVTSQFKITNNSNFVENLVIDIAKFEAAEGGNRPLISEMSDSDTYQEWVEFDNPSFSVQPGETKTISFTITPSDTASLGYYYAFVVNRQDEMNVEQGAAVSGSPALLTLLEVKSPNAKRELQLIEFTTGSMFYEYLPTEFKIKVKNTGNIHLAPSGDVFIDSLQHKNVATLRVNEGVSNVMPNTQRELNVSWQDGFAVRAPKTENGATVKNDKGEIVYETKYDFEKANKFRFGKYTATLVMAYDNGERDVPIEATVSFWVIPWKILGIGAVVLLFALLGLKNTIMPFVRRITTKEKKSS